MGFFINKSFSPEDMPEINEEMAQKLLMKLLSLAEPSETNPPSEVFTKSHKDAESACLHIGEYIHDLMFNQNFSAVDITIHKDDDNQLIFNLNKTES